ncbi:MAG: GNAT family N-acetyltransferase [Candidatus Eremiobacteraeota bacterium]|nr:GNAT family N-acetyltransferase [Candidatus Eremiobacteraeota bacterium]MBC5827928.1 GNAT family N-acetyltransferase [Candidatus Eremiobacteraeota bacterium]
MHPGSILAAYDDEMRAHPPRVPRLIYQAEDGVLRALGEDSYIIYSKLDSSTAESVISREINHFNLLGRKFEWKVYGHDLPDDLEARLQAHGFEADEPETLMMANTAELAGPICGIDARVVRTEAALRDMMAVHEAAFMEKGDRLFDVCKSRLRDETLRLFVIYVGGDPVSAGRLELPPHRSFASLWGGGTIPEQRGKGLFRALVAVRAAEAYRLGYRYLTVDARESSRAILERLGFIRLTSVTGWNFYPRIR